MNTINSRKDAQNAAMAQKAADLKLLVQAVWKAKGRDNKRIAALAMAEACEVGGKESFIESINAAETEKVIDSIAANAMLKGEGMSTKRY